MRQTRFLLLGGNVIKTLFFKTIILGSSKQYKKIKEGELKNGEKLVGGSFKNGGQRISLCAVV